MKLAIVGSAGAGKSTLFRILTGVESSHPRGFVSGIGVAELFDPRLEKIADAVGSKKRVHPHVELHDFDGFGRMWREERAGEIQNALLGFDGLIQVVNAFSGKDPVDDFQKVDLNFIVSDLSIVENAKSRVRKEVQAKKASPKLLEALEKVEKTLSDGKSVLEAELSESERRELSGYSFVSALPRVVVVNVSEDAFGRSLKEFEDVMHGRKIPYIYASLEIEEEIMQLDGDEQAAMLSEYNIEAPLPQRLIPKILKALDLITFFTATEKEARAWLLKNGLTVLKAAGKVHTDMERGFIRAEVFNYEDLMEYGDIKALKAAGRLRLEGRDYIVKDGDIVFIRFSK